MTDSAKRKAREDKLSRRDLLLLIPLGGLTALMASNVIPLEWEMAKDSIRRVGDKPFKAFNDYSSLGKCADKAAAWVVVHRGFVDRNPIDKVLDTGLDDTKYRAYMRQTGKLLKYLRQSGEPAFLVVENHVFQESGGKTDSPGACTTSIVTYDGFGVVKPLVDTRSGTLEQSIPVLKKALRDMGIRAINFAGELVYTPLDGGACLYGIAELFADEFEIKGIEGCLFPPAAPSSPDALEKKLYFHQVPVPTV